MLPGVVLIKPLWVKFLTIISQNSIDFRKFANFSWLIFSFPSTSSLNLSNQNWCQPPRLNRKNSLVDYLTLTANHKPQLSHSNLLRHLVACWMMNSQLVLPSRPRPSLSSTPLCPVRGAPPPTPPMRESSPSALTIRSPRASSESYLSLLSPQSTLVGH